MRERIKYTTCGKPSYHQEARSCECAVCIPCRVVVKCTLFVKPPFSSCLEASLLQSKKTTGAFNPRKQPVRSVQEIYRCDSAKMHVMAQNACLLLSSNACARRTSIQPRSTSPLLSNERWNHTHFNRYPFISASRIISPNFLAVGI